MNALRQLVIVPVIAIMLGSAGLLAQMTDSMASDATARSSATAIDNANNGKDMSRYYWIGGVVFIVVVFGVGYIVRSKRKKGDNPHLSGDSINNPASGI